MVTFEHPAYARTWMTEVGMERCVSKGLRHHRGWGGAKAIARFDSGFPYQEV